MPFQIIKGSILDIACEAIVNPTDEVFSGGGGLDRQIHLAAGEDLRRECATIGRLGIGQAAVTGGGALSPKKIIHTVAPWYEGNETEVAQLRQCYRSALCLVEKLKIETVAMPLIGSGTRGFPKELVLSTAAEEIQRFLQTHSDFTVYLTVYHMEEFRPDRRLTSGLRQFIRRQRQQTEEAYLSEAVSEAALGFPAMDSMPPQSTAVDEARRKREHGRKPKQAESRRESLPGKPAKESGKATAAPSAAPQPAVGSGFQPGRQPVLDESFSQMVMRKIDEKGFKKDSECYVRANMDRKLFSKIRSDIHYHPKKTTALALAVALELSVDETNELLMKAGYTLSPSILFDIIVKYCIQNRIYNIMDINQQLFLYDQPLLGA